MTARLAFAAAAVLASAPFGAWIAHASATPVAAVQRCGGPPRPTKPTSQVKADLDGDGRSEAVFVYRAGGEWRLWSATTGSGTVTGRIGPTLTPSDVVLHRPVRFGNGPRAVVPTEEGTGSNAESVRLERLVGCRLLPLAFAGRGLGNQRTLYFGGGAFAGVGVRCLPAKSLVLLERLAVYTHRAVVTTWTYRVSSQRAVIVSKTTRRLPISNGLDSRYESLRCGR